MTFRVRRLPRLALAGVQAELHPVELGEHVVGQVEAAVAADVDLGPAQDAERRELLVGERDLLALAPQRVRVEAGHDADVLGVVADGDVLVAAVARRGPHLEHGRLAVRPGRVAVEVAAHVRELDEAPAARRETAPRAAPAGTRGCRAPRRRPPRRAPRAAARAPRRTRARRSPGRARSRTRVGPRDDELHGHALDRDADGAPRRALDDRHDRAAAPRTRPGRAPAAPQRRRRRARSTCPPSGAGRRRPSPPSRAATSSTERPRPVERRARAAARPGVPRPAVRGSAPRSPGRFPAPSAAGRRARRPELVGRPHVERAPDLEHALRPDPEQAPEADELRLHLALELVELGDRARSPPARRGARRSRARSRAAPARARRARARRPAPASPAPSRRRAGTRVPCSARSRPGRAGRRTPPAARRSGRCRAGPDYARTTSAASRRIASLQAVQRISAQELAASSRAPPSTRAGSPQLGLLHPGEDGAYRALRRPRRPPHGCLRGRRASRSRTSREASPPASCPFRSGSSCPSPSRPTATYERARRRARPRSPTS